MSMDILDRPAPRASQRVAYGSEISQFGELWLPEHGGPFPVAVAIHGGFWRARYNLQYMGHLCTKRWYAMAWPCGTS